MMIHNKGGMILKKTIYNWRGKIETANQHISAGTKKVQCNANLFSIDDRINTHG